jgi:hypothetical protein
MATFQLVNAFLTTLYQCHIAMGGLLFAAIGYEVADALERYQRQHDIEGVPSFKQLLRYVESEISIPVSLATLEDSSDLTCMFLCCYVDTRIRVYDCENPRAAVQGRSGRGCTGPGFGRRLCHHSIYGKSSWR